MIRQPNLVGGNTLLVFWGNLLRTIGIFLTEKGDKAVYNGNSRVISNPSASWYNPFTIVYTFTIDNTQKYQLIIENSAYKSRYVENNQEIILTEEELYLVIRNNKQKWFLKN